MTKVNTWVPIADAAKRLGFGSVDEFAQALIALNEQDQDEPARFAVKAAYWTVRRFPGLRTVLMARKFGDPPISVNFPQQHTPVNIAGYFQLHKEATHLAFCWPDPCDRRELQLWTDNHPAIADEADILHPCENGPVRFDQLYVHADDLEQTARTLNSQVAGTLHQLVGVLAMLAGHEIHSSPLMPIARDIAAACKNAGVALNERTIFNHLKSARELVRPMKT